MSCRVIAVGDVRMWACRIDEDAAMRAEQLRLEADAALEDAEQLELVELDDEIEDGADGCDWRDDGDADQVEGDRLVEVGAAWFDANLDDEVAS